MLMLCLFMCYTSLDGVAGSIAAMGGACLLNMYVYATIIDYNSNTYYNNTYNTTLVITTYHLIASSLSLIYLSSTALSLSLASASASASISLPSHQHINTSAYQHISSTSAAHQQHISSTSAHQHISTSSRSHQHHQHHIKLDPL